MAFNSLLADRLSQKGYGSGLRNEPPAPGLSPAITARRYVVKPNFLLTLPVRGQRSAGSRKCVGGGSARLSAEIDTILMQHGYHRHVASKEES
jgi:hypothetical protein